MGGCISRGSKSEAQKRFHVKNLDDDNRIVGEGELEVTETHLILYSKNQPIKWPLKYLRRYGYDDNLFSFEAGRRCPTGEGIYAFSTRSAEAIFRLVETNIRTGKSKNLKDEDPDGAAPQSGSVAARVSPSPPEAASSSSSAPIHANVDFPAFASPNSGVGTAKINYAELDLPPANKEWRISQNPVPNKKGCGYATIDFQATEAAKIPDHRPLNYAEVDFRGQSTKSSKPTSQMPKTEYAEVIPNLRQIQPSNGVPTAPVHYADVSVVRPLPESTRQARQEEVQLAYVQLDLRKPVTSGGTSGSSSGPNKKLSASEVQYSYTQIDFTKTQALSQVASGGGEYENTSSRQTRHT